MNSPTPAAPRRIAFLSASLEQGRDGVGDYCRRLGLDLVEQGCQVLQIALNDRYCVNPVVEVESGMRLLRLPAKAWESDDLSLALTELKGFKPHWLSLQMAVFGYEHRGLLWHTQRRLAELARTAPRRHLMLHELWVGVDRTSPLRLRLLGQLQRWLLLRSCSTWGAEVTHTSNPVYQELLRRAGITADLLPLPGNIPIAASSAIVEILEAARSDPELAPLFGSSSCVVGIFGGLHPFAGFAERLQELASAIADSGLQPVFVQLGRAGAAGAALWSAVVARPDRNYACVTLGERSPMEVSAWMQHMQLGLAMSPWALIGKSGSVSGMLEHGLPVLVPRMDWQLRSGPTPGPIPHPLLLPWTEDSLQTIRQRGQCRQPAVRLPSVGAQLLNSLHKTRSQ